MTDDMIRFPGGKMPTDADKYDAAVRRQGTADERELNEVRERIRGIFTASIAERLVAIEARLAALEKSHGASS